MQEWYLRVVPVLGAAERIVKVLEHLLAGCHGAGRVHRVDGAALRVDVREGGQSALLKVGVELAGVRKAIHGIVLNPLRRISNCKSSLRSSATNLVHERIDDISLVVL